MNYTDAIKEFFIFCFTVEVDDESVCFRKDVQEGKFCCWMYWCCLMKGNFYIISMCFVSIGGAKCWNFIKRRLFLFENF